ncbi:hypothetical protein NQ317_008545 [Molorchus minor]|uniref:Gustatory receptor n=1 Tax=Molorchus minor TaxID=1323400 RepID=A0ABQ9J3X1_9CUCU|nr:hypothetical protein NQ317_008545 [Molorchus minor]
MYSQSLKKRSVYLEGTQPYYQNSSNNTITKLLQDIPGQPLNAFKDSGELDSVIFDTLKPILTFLRIVGIFPLGNSGRIFQMTVKWMIYSATIYLIILGYIGYIRWDKVELVRSAEARFEEAVIDYLFTIYLVPIVINPIIWYER